MHGFFFSCYSRRTYPVQCLIGYMFDVESNLCEMPGNVDCQDGYRPGLQEKMTTHNPMTTTTSRDRISQISTVDMCLMESCDQHLPIVIHVFRR
ncbi:hypothetical protein ACOMHN_026748 [Nucella lapillus]